MRPTLRTWSSLMGTGFGDQACHVCAAARHAKAVRQPSPFVAQLLACFRTETTIFTVLDDKPTCQLSKLLETIDSGNDSNAQLVHRCLPTQWFEVFAAEVALAIDHIHSSGLYFVQLNPNTIQLDSGGHVRVEALARPLTLDQLNRIAQDNMEVSWLREMEYLAPEAMQAAKISSATDWWAFGCLLFECVAGSSPFYDSDAKEVKRRVLNQSMDVTTFNSPSALLSDGQPRNMLRSLVMDLLSAKATRRPTLDETKRHHFFRDISFQRVQLGSYPTVTPPSLKYCFGQYPGLFRRTSSIIDKPMSESNRMAHQYQDNHSAGQRPVVVGMPSQVYQENWQLALTKAFFMYRNLCETDAQKWAAICEPLCLWCTPLLRYRNQLATVIDPIAHLCIVHGPQGIALDMSMARSANSVPLKIYVKENKFCESVSFLLLCGVNRCVLAVGTIHVPPPCLLGHRQL